MAERTSYTEGTPSWVDLGTPDLEAAKRFYGDLFGWTYEGGGEEVGHYTNALRDGLPVAALAPQHDPSVPPRWTTYLASDDADRTAARIADAGGRLVVEPMDVLEFGRMLVAFDPGGAPFGVWQGKQHIGARRVNEHGAIVWNELHTRDGAAADDFYRSVFGYDQEKLGDGQAFDYSLYKVGDAMIGGRNQLGPDDATPPGWLAYFAVDDPDAAVATATAGGATVVAPARDSEYGRMAVLTDPWGATFAVITAPGGDT
ncbi:MAG: Glyoxalase/bleomycin resistance protein/dioxygenase [Mycobacterium sp.]|jgi:predicted enzyme related to lactoylglutathione lyase|nr:Glyoxalase/bleomycin resistance protein/dioxygenase [Mycobacterium sp.]